MVTSEKKYGLSGHDFQIGADILGAGGIVAFPTETSYGLAVDPFNREALARLFKMKRRSLNKPVLALIRDRKQLSLLVSEIPSLYEPLIHAFWPGPLTLVFEALPHLPDLLTGGTGTVGVRISSHPAAMKLVEAAGKPITATSANISGQPAAVSAAEVRGQFGDAIDRIIDGGSSPGGKGSTILGCLQGRLTLIRDGVIPYETILRAVARRNEQDASI